SHLTERIIREGGSVVGIDSFAPTYDSTRRRQRILELGRNGSFEFIEGDLRMVDLGAYVRDADVVFHLAARPGVRASWSDFANVDAANVLGTQRVLDAIRGTDTKLVFASSSSVYGATTRFPTQESDALAPISPYGVTKAACEALIGAYVSQFGVRAVSLRYFTVFGPWQRSDMAFTRWITNALMNQPLPLFGDGSAVRDFTYVDDVVEATVAAADRAVEGHEIFNVAGGEPVTVGEVLEEIERLIGRPLEIQRLKPAEGDPARTGGDTTRIRSRLGWEAKWGLSDGLARQVEWLQGLLGR
ncbi:MAG: NAD-dependent epimerase/dehydratase family protein, partial [Rhodothermales bacterium]|nr:NAD-dependent epimerase/dehydratase family protein [Rhodothermales bacterium]